jgi:hypothetical protein
VPADRQVPEAIRDTPDVLDFGKLPALSLVASLHLT